MKHAVVRYQRPIADAAGKAELHLGSIIVTFGAFAEPLADVTHFPVDDLASVVRALAQEGLFDPARRAWIAPGAMLSVAEARTRR